MSGDLFENKVSVIWWRTKLNKRWLKNSRMMSIFLFLQIVREIEVFLDELNEKVVNSFGETAINVQVLVEKSVLVGDVKEEDSFYKI